MAVALSLALNNGKAFVNGKLSMLNILIEGKKISGISKKRFGTEKEIDCNGKIILPGAIDAHVHFRCPGFEHKEDWFSGSLAALHGGITTVMDMPNTKPATDSRNALEEKRAIAKDAMVNKDFFVAATNENLQEIASIPDLRGVKVYYGPTTGNILFNDSAKLAELFRLSKKNGFVVVVHAEDEETISRNAKKFAGIEDASVHEKIGSEEAEAKAIAGLIELHKKNGGKLHIAHVSSRKGIQLIARAKKTKSGKNLTCEATPNHLFLDSSAYKKLGNLVKCNPSIKSAVHRKALWKAFVKGTIDIVATDHAPHTQEEKAKKYSEAPSGIPGVETMLPLLLDAVSRKKIPLKRVVEAVSEKPAQIFNWKTKGLIKKGFDADLVIIDMKKAFTVKNEELFTKAKYSPFNGQRLKCFIAQAIVGGQPYG